jgi:hypothetical protein
MALPANLNPLTGTHYDQVMEALRSIHNYRQLAAAAQGAGMDIRAHEQLADHLETQLKGIQQHFFPQGRPKP